VGIHRRPVQVIFSFGGQVGHTALITGYRADGYVWMNDPLKGSGWGALGLVARAYDISGGYWSHTCFSLGGTNAAFPVLSVSDAGALGPTS
jgi:hypothetical protein